MSHRSDPDQATMFVFTKRPAAGQDESTTLARWLYPCALCNELECEVAGTLCPACEKPRKRAASIRRAVRKAAAESKSGNVVKLPERRRS